MKKAIIIVPILAFAGIFIAKISNWFFHYSDETNKWINMTMFCFIGIWYIADSFKQRTREIQALFLACGIYLILMNFFERTSVISIVGIISIILPVYFIRKNRKRKEQEELEEQ